MPTAPASPSPRLADLLSAGRASVARLSDGTGVLLDVQGLTVFTLNEAGLVLVEALRAGAASEDDAAALAALLVARFEVSPAAAAADVAAFLAALKRSLPAAAP